MNSHTIRNFSLAVALGASFVASCNPKAASGTNVMPNVGIRDYFTARANPDGAVAVRDLPATPRPREAITSDDYFGIKLEHMYAGNMLGREVGNLAIVAQVGGILPVGINCEEMQTSEIGFQPTPDATSNRKAVNDCKYKTIVQVNPVFQDAHISFDSAFITPPFRTGNEPLRLQFIMARLNDMTLARKIADWAKSKSDAAQSADVLNLGAWQKELVSIGFSAVNWLLDYAAQPTFVFEMTTDFVPVETVEGAQPQSLLMGGNFVLVGITPDPRVPAGALKASEQLIFNSGRLYWKDTREEYRESPYAIFNVVRFSRYPNNLPVNLARVQRQVRRGESPDDIVRGARTTVLDLQDARTLNETEGTMLLDLFDWYARAARLDAKFNDRDYGKGAPPMALARVAQTNPMVAAGVAPVDDLKQAADLMRQLDERLFKNYGQTPGFRQDECVTIRSLTQSLADAYRSKRPEAIHGFEDLQIRRLQLQRNQARTPDQQSELDAIEQVESALEAQVNALPETLPEPQCPQLRQAYVVE